MKLSYLVSLSTAIAIFSGCGSSGGSSDETVNQSSVNGQFIDSAVQGLEYTCSSGISGVTDVFGGFTCDIGDTVVFSINGYEIGSVGAQETVTPKTLYPNDNEKMTNLARLLQTLDSDNNPNNGISIDNTSSEYDGLLGVILPLNQADFDSAMATFIGKTLVDEATALAHLELSIANEENRGVLTALSSVYVFNGTTESFCAAQNPYDDSYNGYDDFEDFVDAGGSSVVKYSPSIQSCSSYTEAGYCLEQDLSIQIGGTGSCIQTVTFAEDTSTGGNTGGGTTPSDEISFSEYTSKYKPMMPNLRSDNIYFTGTAYTVNSNIDIEYQAMTAEPKIADVLYFIGGDLAYGYEVYTDTYTSTTLNTQYYDSESNYSNNEGDWNITIEDNIHTIDGEAYSTKFSKPINMNVLHEMYLEVGLDIAFNENDKGQFSLTSDSNAHGQVSLGLNESAYLKVVSAF